ncbi:MAG: aspartate carbamoyltransferase [Thermoplasmatales archaeon]|jgi:aspartate carbamoyltransferase catalytic subunit|nr:aspartate carbamoyltransferase [Candidatus Thermoplasmatota archaeon]MCL6002777.1 aspartate carbamoyltransferase [Candidatus Thermoplasmatota archaeon]MDA8056148.1 aspartate carbamoyltransferase [Thermoplasmatales archaeon]
MWLNRDIVSIGDFSVEEIMEIIERANKMVPYASSGHPARPLSDKIVATLFYEPSTRTRLSFESATMRLGGKVLGFGSLEGSSVAKGETLSDTIRIVNSYSDAIVLRHPSEGAARLASEFADVPVINAGDGAGQHPTQTILDIFTIWKEVGPVNGKSIGFVGDLKYGRTVHSLSKALSMFDVSLFFISPEELRIPKHIKKDIERRVPVKETKNLDEVIEALDVLYVTRIQKERFPDLEEYKRVAGIYVIKPSLISRGRKNLIVMHPLPRVDEIPSEIDNLPQAKYFKQASYGVPVRMAILDLILRGE